MENQYRVGVQLFACIIIINNWIKIIGHLGRVGYLRNYVIYGLQEHPQVVFFTGNSWTKWNSCFKYLQNSCIRQIFNILYSFYFRAFIIVLRILWIPVLFTMKTINFKWNLKNNEWKVPTILSKPNQNIVIIIYTLFLNTNTLCLACSFEICVYFFCFVRLLLI